ncbi:protein-disulfide isomerase [Mycoplana sp. BE70]|uniref:DsbA family protein n=1 Tax=Mycoplana sp. BE70 TaxID=2817775 RepID=UPI0028544EA2|nr:DsbA family protein [Mycoplana sp. BE70]MDR6758999.1 protein-disulfide isomerase [Mycoplana sp. BE70]
MFRTTKSLAAALALACTVSIPLPALALDAKQKEEIGAYIKEYLLANPEILMDMQEALQQKQTLAQQQQAASAIAENQKAIFNAKYDISLGNPDGDVTIVEFFDYNCGYCKRALSDMDAMLEADKNVRFVLKELPILGPDSLAAHKVSAAFRDLAPEKYGEFHRALLGAESRATEESAIEVAVKLGVSEADIRKAMAEKPHDDAVRDAYTLAQSLGITGTPSYVISNEAVFGAVGVDELRDKVANVRSCGKTAC